MNTIFSMNRFLQQLVWIVCLLFLLAPALHAQAPGGVTAGLSSWFKADGNVLASGNPNYVTCWTSEVSSDIRLLSPGPARRPVLETTTTATGNFNFNPFVQFIESKATCLNRPSDTPNLVGRAGTVFLVTNMVEDSRNEHTAFTYRASSDYRYQIKPGWRIQVGENGKGWTQDLFKEKVPFAASLQSAIILISRGNGRNFRGRKNADSIPLTVDGQTDFNPAVVTGLYLGCNGPYGTEPFNGGIAEVITYNTTLEEADVNKIESYLSLKYGVTMCQRSYFGRSPSNYTAANGTVLWQASANKGFSNCITGIGRDDAAGLLQKQSRSVHNNALVYLYNGAFNGSFPASNAGNTNAITENNSFLLAGDNAQGTALTTCTAGKKYKRMERIWKVQITGSGITTVTIAVNKEAVPADAKGLLVAADAAFGTGVTFYPFATADGKLYAQLKLNNGDFFTMVSNTGCQ